MILKWRSLEGVTGISQATGTSAVSRFHSETGRQLTKEGITTRSTNALCVIFWRDSGRSREQEISISTCGKPVKYGKVMDGYCAILTQFSKCVWNSFQRKTKRKKSNTVDVFLQIRSRLHRYFAHLIYIIFCVVSSGAVKFNNIIPWQYYSIFHGLSWKSVWPMLYTQHRRAPLVDAHLNLPVRDWAFEC